MATKARTRDWGGMDLTLNNLELGVTRPGRVGTGTAVISGAELAVLDGVTAGTVTASKAVVVDSSKDISGFQNITQRGPAGTGAASASVLTLQTAEPTVVDGDQLGRIDFQAPLETGADAILVAASIYAEADDTFAATVNDTDLVIALGVSEAAAEKFRFSSAGYLEGGRLRSVVADGASVTLTQAQSGALCVFDKVDGALFTLPSPVAGLYYDFIVTASVTSNSMKVITNAGTVFIVGTVTMVDSDTTFTGSAQSADGSTHVAVTMASASTNSTGGILGTRFRLTCISATQWAVEGSIIHAGNVATPFTTS